MMSLKRSALLVCLAAVLTALMPQVGARSHDDDPACDTHRRGDSSWETQERPDWSGHEYWRDEDNDRRDEDCERRPPPPPPPRDRFGPNPDWPPGPAYRGHDQAREAVRRGEALPLREVLRRVRGDYPGRVLRVQFEYDDHFELWVYDIRMLFDDNRLLRLKVDALSAEVLLVRGVKRPHSKGH